MCRARTKYECKYDCLVSFDSIDVHVLAARGVLSKHCFKEACVATGGRSSPKTAVPEVGFSCD